MRFSQTSEHNFIIMRDDLSTHDRNWIAFLYLFLSLLFIGSAIIFSSKYDSKTNIWEYCLFLIPIAIHWIGLFFTQREATKALSKLNNLKNKSRQPNGAEDSDECKELSDKHDGMVTFCIFYNITKLISVFLYCLGWVAYSRFRESQLAIGDFSILEIFSYLCLAGILIQSAIVALVTYLFMEDSENFAGAKILGLDIVLLKKGFSLFPFWRFAHFFAIFMSIAFLFGFAFAFHDSHYRLINPEITALYVENLSSPDDIVSTEKKDNAPNAPAETKQQPPKNNQPVCFYFESGKAKFLAKDYSEPLKEPKNLKPEARLKYERENKNHVAINNLLSQIQSNRLQDIPRITLIGRADDKKAGDLYPSNYDLSEARTQRMRSEITNALNNKNEENGQRPDWQRIDWQRIDWVLVPYSNEDSQDVVSKCKDESLEKLDPDSGKRVVEGYLTIVSQDTNMIQTKNLQEKQMKELNKSKHKPPNLMDYMYFSIYTISTTGYGDIKPATNYAKFLISIENFFEIFFLVCFMNTLIALKGETKM